MQLMNELHIKKDQMECISIVGAGGKTTAMFTLARELKASGCSVLVTTTTHIYMPEHCQYDKVLVSDEWQDTQAFVNQIEKPGIYVIGSSVTEDGKLKGILPECVDKIFEMNLPIQILAESDGSKHKPVKAPAEHEPVIPASATKVIGVVGLDCLGKPAHEDYVHRLHEFTEITGCLPSEAITAEAIAALINHPLGLFKNAPVNAERFVFLNKADDEERVKDAEAIKQKIHGNFHIQVAITSLLVESTDITAIILAAGTSSRMGQSKLLMPFGENLKIIEKVMKEVKESGCFSEILLIYSDDRVAKLAGSNGIKSVYNSNYMEGQSTSIIKGVLNAAEKASAYMFFAGDQPFIDIKMIKQLVQAYKVHPWGIILPIYEGKPGLPTIFSKIFKSDLLAIRGDVGGRGVIKAHEEMVVRIVIEEAYKGLDIDTKQDYENLITRMADALMHGGKN